MNEHVEKALHHLTGKRNIDSVSVEELENIIAAHPYFSVAHVLLAKKLKSVNADGFLPKIQKTALYFTNPHWLHYQLMDQVPALNIDRRKATQEQAPTLIENTDEVIEQDTDAQEDASFEVSKDGVIQLSAPEAPVALLNTDSSFDEDTNSNAEVISSDIKSAAPAEEDVSVGDHSELTLEQPLSDIVEEISTSEDTSEVKKEQEPTNIVNITDDNSTTQDKVLPASNPHYVSLEEVTIVEDKQTEVEEQTINTEPDFVFASDQNITVTSNEGAVQDLEAHPTTLANVNEQESNLAANAEHLLETENIYTTPEIENPSEPENAGSKEEIENPNELETVYPTEENINSKTEEHLHLAPKNENLNELEDERSASVSTVEEQIDAKHEENTKQSELTPEESTTKAASAFEELPFEDQFDVAQHAGNYRDNDLYNVDYNNQYDYDDSTETSVINHSMQPPLPTDIHTLDNPLIQNYDQKEQTVEDETSEKDDDEIPLDELHPEKEEVLEEIAQEKSDEEANVSALPNSDTITEETSSITLPLNEEDTAIIDNFVESQHEQKPEDNQPQETPSTVDQPPTTSTPASLAGEPLIPIEPYHTVDYFASQGIKLTLDKEPKDRLGKQLKSFTQWLKHMKRLGPEDSRSDEDEDQIQSKIQGIANSSNQTEEVVTEAMAEVLIKQGKIQHAIEVYNKLSFLNPDKRPYFADQIQKIKR